MKKASNPPPQGKKPPAPPTPPCPRNLKGPFVVPPTPPTTAIYKCYPYAIGRIAAITEFENVTPGDKIKHIREALLACDPEIFDTPEEKRTRRILKDSEQ